MQPVPWNRIMNTAAIAVLLIAVGVTDYDWPSAMANDCQTLQERLKQVKEKWNLVNDSRFSVQKALDLAKADLLEWEIIAEHPSAAQADRDLSPAKVAANLASSLHVLQSLKESPKRDSPEWNQQLASAQAHLDYWRTVTQDQLFLSNNSAGVAKDNQKRSGDAVSAFQRKLDELRNQLEEVRAESSRLGGLMKANGCKDEQEKPDKPGDTAPGNPNAPKPGHYWCTPRSSGDLFVFTLGGATDGYPVNGEITSTNPHKAVRGKYNPASNKLEFTSAGDSDAFIEGGPYGDTLNGPGFLLWLHTAGGVSNLKCTLKK